MCSNLCLELSQFVELQANSSSSIQTLSQDRTVFYCRCLIEHAQYIKRCEAFQFITLCLFWHVIHIPLSLHRVTKPKGNVSSIICLSQHMSEVRDVPLSVFIDKSPVLTTKVFYYKDNPQITAVLPGCSFDRQDSQTSSTTSCVFVFRYGNQPILFLIFLTNSFVTGNGLQHVTISYICLDCRGSKIVIEGENLDSVYRTIVRFKPNESHLKPVTRVQCSLLSTVDTFKSITLLVSLLFKMYLISLQAYMITCCCIGLA